MDKSKFKVAFAIVVVLTLLWVYGDQILDLVSPERGEQNLQDIDRILFNY